MKYAQIRKTFEANSRSRVRSVRLGPGQRCVGRHEGMCCAYTAQVLSISIQDVIRAVFG